MQINRQFPSSPRPLYQNEVKRSAFDMEKIFHSNANKTHFQKKGYALSLILKVRVFGTRKWPIGLLTGQCFTHAHSHITWAGAAMDSCFALIGAHQHGITWEVVAMDSSMFRPYWGSSAWHSRRVYERARCWRTAVRFPANSSHKRCVELTLKGVLCTRLAWPVNRPDGNTMLMSPNKGETAVHGCPCPGDMAVRMREVLAGPWVGLRVPLS